MKKLTYTKALERYQAALKAAQGDPELIERIRQTFKRLKAAMKRQSNKTRE